MLFEKFFRIISGLLPVDHLIGNLDALGELNPNRIYAENVRSVFNISIAAATRFCDAAARKGVFLRMVEVECPGPERNIAASAASESDLPKTVWCSVDVDGSREEVEFATADLRKNVFYRLIDAADHTSEAHTSPA